MGQRFVHLPYTTLPDGWVPVLMEAIETWKCLKDTKSKWNDVV